SAHTCASRWCDSSTGWACCRWVRPGMGTATWASACSIKASTRSSTWPATSPPACRRYMRNWVATWSLRERPARSRPPSSAPTRSISPRSSAVCTSSSSTEGLNMPAWTSAANCCRPASIASSSSSSSRPARCNTLACAREPAMSNRASRQSNCVDRDSSAKASAGSRPNRPPHRLVGFGSSPSSMLLLTHGSHLRREPVQLDETLCVGLVEGVTGVISREAEVVQALLGTAAGDRGASTVQRHPDVTGDVLVAVLDERVQRAFERARPLPVVGELGPALVDSTLEPTELALHGDVLQLLVRGDQGDRTGCL